MPYYGDAIPMAESPMQLTPIEELALAALAAVRELDAQCWDTPQTAAAIVALEERIAARATQPPAAPAERPSATWYRAKIAAQWLQSKRADDGARRVQKAHARVGNGAMSFGVVAGPSAVARKVEGTQLDAPPAPAVVQGLSELVEAVGPILFMAEELNKRPRPMCRDCADHDGICPNTGFPCDTRRAFERARNALAEAAEQAPEANWIKGATHE